MRAIKIIMRVFSIMLSIAVLLFTLYIFPWFVVSEFIEGSVLLGFLWVLASIGGIFLGVWIIYLWDKFDEYLDSKYYIYKRGLQVLNEEKQLRLEASKTYPDDWTAAEIEVERMIAEKAINNFHKTKTEWINYTTEQRKYYREKREAIEGVVLDEGKN